MKKKFSILALLVCSFVVCLAAFADLNGKWKGVLKFGDFELPLTYTFKVDGETVTGACNTEQGDFPISNGKIKGIDMNGYAFFRHQDMRAHKTILPAEVVRFSIQTKRFIGQPAAQ